MIAPDDLLPPDRRAPASEIAPLLARMGAALLRFGCATPRVERCLVTTAACHGHGATVFAVPTGIWMTVGDRGDVQMERVDGGEVDLGRLAELDALFNDLSDGSLGVDEAHEWLDGLDAHPPDPFWRGALAGAAATGSTAVFFGGNVTSLAVATVLGAFLVGFMPLLDRSPRVRPLTELAVGLTAGLACWMAVTIDPDTARKPLVLAGIILVVPGLTLTAGLSDLVGRNLVAAAAHLMSALRTLVLLVFGVSLALVIEAPAAADTVQPIVHPTWLMAIATGVGAAAFAVFFRVPGPDFVRAVAAGMLAWGSASAAQLYLPNPTMAAFLGALVVGLFANAMARNTDRPAQIYLLSGIVMLVPGTLSFLSFGQLLSGAVDSGTAGLANTLFSAGALAIGILVADAALPARKVL